MRVPTILSTVGLLVLLPALLLGASGQGVEAGARQDGRLALEGDLVIVEFPEAKFATLAGEILTRAEESVRLVSEYLGTRPQGPYYISLEPTREDFERHQPSGAPPPEWAAAMAYPRLRQVYLLTPSALKGAGDFWSIVRHEMAHLVLEEKLQERSVEIPRWLNEGVATFVSGEMDVSRILQLFLAQVTGQVPSFRELEDDFPVASLRAEAAYGQSYLFVQFLSRRFGKDAVGRLVGAMEPREEGGGIENAAKAAFGVDWGTLMEDFRGYSRIRGGWIPGLASAGAIWGITSLLFLLSYVRKKARNRKTLRKWEEEEAWERAEEERGEEPRVLH